MNGRSFSGSPFWPAVLCLIVSAVGSPLFAQGGELFVEVGGSTIRPPLGVDGDPAQFLSAGVRALRVSENGSGVFATLLGGWEAGDGRGGDYLSGTVEAVNFWELGRGWSLGLEARGFGFNVREPFPYRALGWEGGPSLRFVSPHVSAELKGLGGTGWSETELVRYTGGPVSRVEDELWRYGGTAEVLAGNGRVMAGVAAGVHESVGGTYRTGGLRLLAALGGPGLELRLDAWETPAGTETTGGMAFVVPLGGWSLRGFLGRTEPDPLTLAEPGGGMGGILVGRRVFGRGPLPPPAPPLHNVLVRGGSTATVELHVTPPRGAREVELLGDFTLWEPVSMGRDGSVWKVELEIPFGTHHFGFLVDGEWYLPEDAPDAVSDEWGRRNATLVIERNDPRAVDSTNKAAEGAVER